MPVTYHYGKFPPPTLDWERLVLHLGAAHQALARYNGLLRAVPNADALLSPLQTHEAVLSCRLEGAQTTLEEVLRFEAGDQPRAPERRTDIQEVLNYRTALRQAAQAPSDIPLCVRLVKNAHHTLMQGVRGEGKAPGEFRRLSVHFGPPARPPEAALFLPISAEQIPEAMSNWEKFLHSDYPDPLVQLALLHVEFEAVHPFLDGNGRVGRLITPLFLMAKKLLPGPHFYLSEYLEKRRDEYYHCLRQVSAADAWTDWCAYFLKAVTEQARTNEAKALKIIDLYEKKKEWIIKVTRSAHAVPALDWFFGNPYFASSDLFESGRIPKPTAARILRIAKSQVMLKEVIPARGRRPGLFLFLELAEITGII